MSRYAIVLAAGRGERLWPFTSTRPKPLMPLPGTTLLGRILNSLRGLVDGAIIVTGYLGWMIRDYVEDYKPGISVRFAEQEEQLGTAHAVMTALNELPRSVDEVLIVYGDIYFEDDDFIKRLVEYGPQSLAVAEHRDPTRYGVVVYEGECLSRIVEKPSRSMEGLVNAGVYLLDRMLLEDALTQVERSPRGEYELTDAITFISRKACVKLVRIRGTWLDVGSPWELLEAVRKELDKLSESITENIEPSVEVEPGVYIRGPVYLSAKAVLRANSVVEGPSWIEGEVGPLAHIRPYTFLAPFSKIGGLVQVKASILMEHSTAPHLNYVGDSVLGEYVNLGAGTVTANLRFDKKTVSMMIRGKKVDTGHRKLGSFIGGYAQTGINVSIMPGVRIGSFSWIAPGLTVLKDVPDCVYVYPNSDGIRTIPLTDKGVDCSPRREPPWRPRR